MATQTTERFFADSDAGKILVVRQELFNPHGKNLHVIFLPWHAGEVPYRWLFKRLTRRGDAVVAYYFAEEILTANAATVLKTYERLTKIVSENLAKITKQNNYQTVNFIGMSLGNVALSVVAEKFRDFSSATLVCTADSLAKSVWFGDRTKDTRAGFETNGLTLSQLETAWQPIEPKNHIQALTDKKVTVIVSKTDTCIPTEFQTEYIRQAQKIIKDLHVKTTRLDHYGAIIKYCLIGKIRL
jgi:acyl transferase domain-containing protein